MNKPRLCELLGVDVDEEFKFKLRGIVHKSKIDENGERYFKTCGTWYSGADETALTFLINHPECIIKKPKWINQEIEDAKAILRIFGKNGIIKRYDKDTTKPYSTLTFNNIYINENLFPGIKEGQEYSIDDIIDQEKGWGDHD